MAVLSSLGRHWPHHEKRALRAKGGGVREGVGQLSSENILKVGTIVPTYMQSENIKWEKPETNNEYILNCEPS